MADNRVWVAFLSGLLLCSAAPLRAGEVDGYPWPPPADLYAAPGTEVAPGLAVGQTLDQSNAKLAKDLLPPEVLVHYEKGDYANVIDSWPEGIIHRDRSFEEATKENAKGKYAIDPKTGTVVDKASGKIPDYIYGMPFPTIAPDDPEGGIKALWNQYHNWWNGGSYHFETSIVWTSPHDMERQAITEVWWQYYQNQNPRYRVENPKEFVWQSITTVNNPADLQGTAFLNWRSQDPEKRDSVWTYVPALRRVRAVTPANRSDGILGSDLSQDDGNFVDMKPEDFTWKTIGVREGLRIVDPESVHGRGGPLEWVEPSGIRDTWPNAQPGAGFKVPDWKGYAWAPVSGALDKRKFWVVEGTPKDRYYLYGKLEVWIDAESWIGAWNRKFNWKGELLNTYEVSAYLHHPIKRKDSDEVEWLWSAQHAWQCAENVKADRATLAGFRPRPDYAFDRRVTHNIDQLFDYNTLSRFGK